MISRHTILARTWSRPLSLAIAAILLGACQQAQQPAPQAATENTTSGDIEWARAALQRNPNLELLATDTNARVFTVRDKHSGEVRAVKLDELAAAPVASLTARASSQDAGRTPAATPSPTPEAQPVASEPAARTSEPAATSQPAPATQTAANDTSATTPGYTIERSAGQVRVSGPGVSIVSSGAGSVDATSDTQRNASEPIICEGARMVHLDNRQLYVEGDAITVRGGCELYITNSRIVATGTGIVVRDGTVHVSNSHIEGVQNSFDADSSAKVFVRASTFKGLPRRSELALVQDQGGNRWR